MAKLGLAVKVYLYNDDGSRTTLYGFEEPIEQSAMNNALTAAAHIAESIKELIV